MGSAGPPAGVHNSTHLQAHIVQLANCPETIKNKYMKNVACSKEAEKQMGKRVFDDVRVAAEDVASTELSQKVHKPGDVPAAIRSAS